MYRPEYRPNPTEVSRSYKNSDPEHKFENPDQVPLSREEVGRARVRELIHITAMESI